MAGCALCKHALAREQQWHGSLKSEQKDVVPELLSSCRRDLKALIAAERSARAPQVSWWDRALGHLELPTVRWSPSLAYGSFLVILGFGAGRLVNHWPLGNLLQPGASSEMSLITPNTHVRDVQPSDDGRIRITVDQVQQGEIIARFNDAGVRELLLAAAKDPADPAVRMDSVQILKSQSGTDVQDALIHVVRQDPNAAVRLKALEGLRRFAQSSETREALKFALEHDVDPSVRSEAIDVLAPEGSSVEFSPDLANTLQSIARSAQNDDYVRTRCFLILREMKSSSDTY